MGTDKIEEVLSENLGEGFRIVGDDGELSPMINWVDWEQRLKQAKRKIEEPARAIESPRHKD